MAFCGRILSSEIGRAMDSAKEAEPLAASCGVPIVRLKVVIFGISCGLAGISGALLVHLLRYADPTAFGGLQSLNLVIMNVIGGMGSIYGSIVGTIFLTTLPELLRSYVELQRVIYGVILIVVMAAMPGGLVELVDKLRLMTASSRKN
jgi:branched-chain amino acid transport system permease protein